jgi:hypothetical protein
MKSETFIGMRGLFPRPSVQQHSSTGCAASAVSTAQRLASYRVFHPRRWVARLRASWRAGEKYSSKNGRIRSTVCFASPTTSAPPLPQGYGLPPSLQPSFSDNRSVTGSGPPPPTTGLPPRIRPYDPFAPETTGAGIRVDST